MANITQQAPMQTPKSPFDPNIELDVMRRRRMAEAMMKSGEQPQGTEVISGVAMQQSPLAALARALTQGVAGYQGAQADKEDADIQTNRQKMMADAIGKVGTDPNSAASMLAQDPTTAPSGMQIALEMMKDKKAMEMARFKADHGGDGGTPAAIKITQEAEKRLKAGDVQGANLLLQVAKTYDKGISPFVLPDPNTPPGTSPAIPALAPKAIDGYGDAVGGIKGTVKGAEQDAKNQSDLDYKPQIANQTAEQTEVGKAQGEAVAGLQDRSAQLPRLEQVVGQLSELGKKATYTMAGQAVNSTKRQLGMPVGEGAVARTEYISKVDNEILPLLRQTFGAQFTAREGDTLRNTLGDPNKSPEEKDAVLRSFIDQKKAQIVVMQQRTGQAVPAIPNQAPLAPQKIIKYDAQGNRVQ